MSGLGLILPRRPSRHANLPSGTWIDLGIATTVPTLGSQAITPGTLWWGLLWLDEPVTIDRIAGYITVAATAGKAIRLAAYGHDDAAMAPGSLIVDGGVALADATGLVSVTVAASLPAGWVHLGASPEANCTLRAYNGVLLSPWGVTSDLNTSPEFGGYSTQAYGAIPATAPALIRSSINLRLAVRKA